MQVIKRFTAFLLIGASITACGGGGGGGSSAPTVPPAGATPPAATPPTASASVSGGTYADTQIVTLSSDQASATLYFTLDGTSPTTSSPTYSDSIAINETATLQFFARSSDGINGEIVSETYVIDREPPSGFSLVPESDIVNAENEASFLFSVVNAESGAAFSLTVDDEDGSTDQLAETGTVTDSESTPVTINLAAFTNGQLTATLTLADTLDNESVPLSIILTKASNSDGVSTIEGNINIAPGTQVDTDLNDTYTSPVSNNSIQEAQLIFSPGLVGGYANSPFSGQQGNSYSDGDDDFYNVFLEAGDQIVLTIAEDFADLDVEVFDSDENLVADSLGIGNTETIDIDTAGDYFIRVYSFAGASNYVLNVGTRILQSTSTLSSFHRFVPNQAIVQLAESPSNNSKTLGWLEARGMLVHRSAAGSKAGRTHLVTFGSADQRRALIRDVTPNMIAPQASAPPSAQALRRETIWAIKALARRAGVDAAEPNFLRQRRLVPNDPLYVEQWHHPHTRLPEAWDITTGSADVRVAVIDTGILAQHPDLANQIEGGYDMISDPENARDDDGFDSDPEDDGDLGLGDGSSTFHGTHVAGIVAAESNNNMGIAGASWQTRIMPIRVLGLYGGSTFDLIQSIRYAAGLSNESGEVPDQAADIINMSLGGGGYSSAEEDAISAAVEAGTIIFAAAGNDGLPRGDYPASYPGVISVASINQNNRLAGYSNYGSTLDIAAPGGDFGQDVDQDGIPDGILSTIGDDRESTTTYGYRAYEGTSMATPHVAGIAALMKAVNPSLSPANFDRLLEEGRITNDLGEPGRDDDFGWGVIDAYKAVTAARDLVDGVLEPLPPSLQINPGNISFGLTQTQKSLLLGNSGDGTITINGVTETADWLTIETESTDDDGLGRYSVIADRSTLAPGSFTTNINIDASTGPREIPVSLRVTSNSFDASAGLLFALLIVSETGEVLSQIELYQPDDGTYGLDFGSVPDGTYELVVGSDMDNDGLVCDAGEACGAYPTFNEPDTLTLVSDQLVDIDVIFDQSRFFEQSSASGERSGRPAEGIRYRSEGKRVSPP